MRNAAVLTFCFVSVISAQPPFLKGLTPAEIAAENLQVAQAACKDLPATPGANETESRLREAIKEHIAGNAPAAAKLVEQLAALPNGKLASGDFHFCFGDLDRAAAAFKSVASPEAEKRLLAVLVAQRRTAEALALTASLLKATPNDPSLLGARAGLLLDDAKPDQLPAIIADLRASVAALPRNPIAQANLGRALFLTLDARNSHAAITEALNLLPTYVPALVTRAQHEFVTGQFSLAVSTAADILRLRPQLSIARLLQGAAFLAQNRVDDAETTFTELLRLEPANREALYQLGFSQFRKSNFDESRKSFEKVYASTPPDIRGLVGLVEIDSAQNKFDQALQRLDAALIAEPSNPILLTARANTSVRAGRLDEAAAAYRKLIAADPKNFNLQMSLGEVLRQKQDWAQAAVAWNAAAAIQPNNPGPLINQAMAVEQLGRFAEAAAIYERILKLDNSNVIALNNYANYLANQRKDLDVALRHALRAAVLASGDPSINDTLGYVYLKRKEPKEAIKIFERLTTDFPKVALFHIHYAEALRQSGDAAGAARECAVAKPAIAADAEKTEFKTMCPATP